MFGKRRQPEEPPRPQGRYLVTSLKQRQKGIDDYANGLQEVLNEGASKGWDLLHIESPNMGGTVVVWDTEPGSSTP